MNKTALKLAKEYRKNSTSFDSHIIKTFYLADPYHRGKLSIVFPLHEEAFNIHFHELDLSVQDLKEKREAKNG